MEWDVALQSSTEIVCDNRVDALASAMQCVEHQQQDHLEIARIEPLK